ncbi:hypothetical protein SNEBB_002170 [Seison nebaliae]|nr:hypothetical protein SNEBB_002170 [Seison nebaliae]
MSNFIKFFTFLALLHQTNCSSLGSYCDYKHVESCGLDSVIYSFVNKDDFSFVMRTNDQIYNSSSHIVIDVCEEYLALLENKKIFIIDISRGREIYSLKLPRKMDIQIISMSFNKRFRLFYFVGVTHPNNQAFIISEFGMMNSTYKGNIRGIHYNSRLDEIYIHNPDYISRCSITVDNCHVIYHIHDALTLIRFTNDHVILKNSVYLLVIDYDGNELKQIPIRMRHFTDMNNIIIQSHHIIYTQLTDLKSFPIANESSNSKAEKLVTHRQTHSIICQIGYTIDQFFPYDRFRPMTKMNESKCVEHLQRFCKLFIKNGSEIIPHDQASVTCLLAYCNEKEYYFNPVNCEQLSNENTCADNGTGEGILIFARLGPLITPMLFCALIISMFSAIVCLCRKNSCHFVIRLYQCIKAMPYGKREKSPTTITKI